MDNDEHWRLFEQLESKLDLDDPSEHRNVMQVLLEVLQSVAENLPEPARDAIEVAQRFHDGSASIQELLASRVAMWKLIEGKDCDFQDPFVCSIRALICVMFQPTPEESPYDTLHCFMQFCDGADFPPESTCRALRSVYGGALAG